MKITIILVIAILMFSTYSFTFADGDFQYWNTEGVAWKINKDWKALVEEEFRFKDDAGKFYYQHTDGGITYTGLAKWLDIGIGYRQIFSRKNDKWKYENMPNANSTVKLDLFGLSLSDRNRIEYRHIEEKDDNWRYRNKFTIALPKLTSFEIQPYAADEIFIDCSKKEFNRNRLYAGIILSLFKTAKLDAYYILQTNKEKNDWTNYNIVGTKVRLSF